jgi:hypothetical protein
MLRFNFRRLAVALLVGSLSLAAFGQARAADEDDDEGATTTKAKAARKANTGDENAATVATTDADKAAVKDASAVLADYLDALKAKKYDRARALTHPQTLKAIANVKKRLGEERHSMAPWYWAKDSYYLTSYRIDAAAPATGGTVVAQVTEDSFQVQEKGEFAGEKSAYLVGKLGGKWYVVDKKSEGDGFTKDSIKYGFPNYFDKPGDAK